LPGVAGTAPWLELDVASIERCAAEVERNDVVKLVLPYVSSGKHLTLRCPTRGTLPDGAFSHDDIDSGILRRLRVRRNTFASSAVRVGKTLPLAAG
jgi:hypothetical protein